MFTYEDVVKEAKSDKLIGTFIFPFETQLEMKLIKDCLLGAYNRVLPKNSQYSELPKDMVVTTFRGDDKYLVFYCRTAKNYKKIMGFASDIRHKLKIEMHKDYNFSKILGNNQIVDANCEPLMVFENVKDDVMERVWEILNTDYAEDAEKYVFEKLENKTYVYVIKNRVESSSFKLPSYKREEVSVNYMLELYGAKLKKSLIKTMLLMDEFDINAKVLDVTASETIDFIDLSKQKQERISDRIYNDDCDLVNLNKSEIDNAEVDGYKVFAIKKSNETFLTDKGLAFKIIRKGFSQTISRNNIDFKSEILEFGDDKYVAIMYKNLSDLDFLQDRAVCINALLNYSHRQFAHSVNKFSYLDSNGNIIPMDLDYVGTLTKGVDKVVNAEKSMAQILDKHVQYDLEVVKGDNGRRDYYLKSDCSKYSYLTKKYSNHKEIREKLAKTIKENKKTPRIYCQAQAKI